MSLIKKNGLITFTNTGNIKNLQIFIGHPVYSFKSIHKILTNIKFIMIKLYCYFIKNSYLTSKSIYLVFNINLFKQVIQVY